MTTCTFWRDWKGNIGALWNHIQTLPYIMRSETEAKTADNCCIKIPPNWYEINQLLWISVSDCSWTRADNVEKNCKYKLIKSMLKTDKHLFKTSVAYFKQKIHIFIYWIILLQTHNRRTLINFTCNSRVTR